MGSHEGSVPDFLLGWYGGEGEAWSRGERGRLGRPMDTRLGPSQRAMAAAAPTAGREWGGGFSIRALSGTNGKAFAATQYIQHPPPRR